MGKCLVCEGEGVLFSKSGKSWTCDVCHGKGEEIIIRRVLITRKYKYHGHSTYFEVFAGASEGPMVLLFQGEIPLLPDLKRVPYTHFLIKQYQISGEKRKGV